MVGSASKGVGIAPGAKIPPHLVKAKAEGTHLVNPIREQVAALTVNTSEEYAEADALLHRIQSSIRLWDDKMEAILAPLREAKSAADALKRDVRRPLVEFEDEVKALMRAYKLQEAKQIEEAREKQAEKQTEVQAKLEETAERELAARTRQLRERLAARRQQLEQEAQTLEREVIAPTVAEHSTTRKVPKWRYVGTLKQLCKDVVAGKVPEGVVLMDYSTINRIHLDKEGRERMASWPNFELYEDIVIAGR